MKNKATEKQIDLVRRMYKSDIFIINGNEIDVEDLDYDIVCKLIDSAYTPLGSIINKATNSFKTTDKIKPKNKLNLSNEKHMQFYRWAIEAGFEWTYVKCIIDADNYMDFYETYNDAQYIGYTEANDSATPEQKLILEWMLDEIDIESFEKDQDVQLLYLHQKTIKQKANKADMAQIIWSLLERYDSIWNWPLSIIPTQEQWLV